MVYSSGNFSRIKYTITLKRVGTTIMDTVLIPGVGLSFLSFFYIFLPTDSGDRLSYVTTMLLTMVMFLVILTSFLPIATTTTRIELMFLILTMMLILATFFVLVIQWLEVRRQKQRK